jgi:hypothetical protein
VLMAALAVLTVVRLVRADAPPALRATPRTPVRAAAPRAGR